MKPKKNNTAVYRIVTIFNPIGDFIDGSGFMTDMIDPDDIIGFEIEHIVSKEIFMYPKQIGEMMRDLNILEPIDALGVRTAKINPYYFDNREYDLGFLNQYIEKENKRPSWEEYFMGIAQMLSSRSTCDRLHVGCVLVKDNHMIAEGYNGSISGAAHCDDVGHLMYEGGCKRTIHAEKNAINMCAKLGISTQGATAYVTHYPCPDCMRELNQAGVKKVIYGSFYKHRFENNFHEGMDLQEFKGRKAIIKWEE